MHSLQRFLTKIYLNVVQLFGGERSGLNDLEVSGIHNPFGTLMSIEM